MKKSWPLTAQVIDAENIEQFEGVVSLLPDQLDAIETKLASQEADLSAAVQSVTDKLTGELNAINISIVNKDQTIADQDAKIKSQQEEIALLKSDLESFKKGVENKSAEEETLASTGAENSQKPKGSAWLKNYADKSIIKK